MSKYPFSWELFSTVPVVGIIRNLSFEEMADILPVYVDSGFTTIEITMNTPDASGMIQYAAEQFGHRLNIGAGTVLDEHDLNAALNAGAGFIVTPVLEPSVVLKCVNKGIPVFPGAFSPTEIYKAWKMGAPMVKVYPAATLGPKYISDIKAPLKQIKLLPTGGIDLNNFQAFMKAGADGIGIGGHLFDPAFIKSRNLAGLKDHFCRFTRYFTRSQETFCEAKTA